jgi:hypothetical protein
MLISLQITLAAETHLADGMSLKLLLTTKVEKSLIILEGICKLTISNMEEQLILSLNALIIIIIICLLIDVAIPSDKNVTQKEAQKELKYKNLSIEIQRMWNMKCFVIPVIIGTTGIVGKSLQKYL